MNIPQSELDKLDNSGEEAFFDKEEEETPEEPKVEKQVSVSTDEDTVADKARVPYSRFETVNERAIAAEAKLALLEEQATTKEKIASNEDISVPAEWVELYGDSDAAKRAYSLQMQSLERMREETITHTLEEIDKRQEAKQSEQEQNLEYIEDNLAKFQEKLGRDLTEAEESAILDIQDEFTPKDDKGNYIAPLLSADKAFEVYGLRTGNATAKKTIARRKVVAVTGSSSEGDNSNSFADFKPGEYGSWRKDLTN